MLTSPRAVTSCRVSMTPWMVDPPWADITPVIDDPMDGGTNLGRYIPPVGDITGGNDNTPSHSAIRHGQALGDPAGMLAGSSRLEKREKKQQWSSFSKPGSKHKAPVASAGAGGWD